MLPWFGWHMRLPAVLPEASLYVASDGPVEQAVPGTLSPCADTSLSHSVCMSAAESYW